ncbi:hypothetical protein KCU81_g9092, partial [Aureobasidium melanogenum]|uniref:Uncharacterized protein n=1 Tax=Aureobasidium melanogenum (strain CBS 110374) TaxID=1043003 RepID=A0A074VKV1_AURM1
MNFFDLPLEIRVMVYENILQEEHHFFRDGVPGLLKTRLQITQEVYSLCKITATVRSEVAPLYMIDLLDIETRVAKFKSRQGNKGIVVRLLCRPELPSDFMTSMEHDILTKAMGINTTIVYTRGDAYAIHVQGFSRFLRYPQIPSVSWSAMTERLSTWIRIQNSTGLLESKTAFCDILVEKCLRITQSGGS